MSCADLEANYNWDCSGCECPGDTVALSHEFSKADGPRVPMSIHSDNSQSSREYTDYNIYRSTVSGTGYVLIGSVDGTTFSFADDTVVNNVTYYYVVTALSLIHI